MQHDEVAGLQVMQPALTTLANCVTVPPSLAHTSCPAEKPSARKRQGRAAGQTPGQLPTPGQAPDTAGKAVPELAQAGSMEVTYAKCQFPVQSFGDAPLLTGNRHALCAAVKLVKGKQKATPRGAST